MCEIQAAQFQKAGSTNIPGCTATLSDNIGLDASISFDRSEVGKVFYCMIYVRFPAGHVDGYNVTPTGHYVQAAGTIDLVIDNILPTMYATGTYMVDSCYIYDSTQTNVVCGMSPGVGNCTTLAVTAAAAPPKAAILSPCWGPTGTLPANCGMTGDNPALIAPVKAGTTIDIKADLYNVSTPGEIMATFKINNVAVHTETNPSLGTYPISGGTWSPIYTGYVMPNTDVTLTVEGYGYDTTKKAWVINDIKTMTISHSAPTCTGMDIDPVGGAIIKGPSLDGKTPGEKVTITVTLTPNGTGVSLPVTFKYRDGTTVGTCSTDASGRCQFVWDSNTFAKTPGAYYIKAYSGSCISTEVPISVSLPISQYNFTITVLNINTNNPVSGATVLTNTVGGAAQSLLTNGNGSVVFRVNMGTINVAISKGGYNTDNEVQSVYNDTTVKYYITPTPPTITVGSINFVSVPVGAEIYIDTGAPGVLVDTKQTTVAVVANINAGPHKWALKFTGFNDANGDVVVPSGSATDVYVSLSPATPISGSLNISSTPEGAEVYIDNQDQNLTSSGATIIDNIPPGKHSLKLTNDGYQDYITVFSIVAGTTTHLNPTLVPVATIGSLDISTDPSGARIFIDDLDTGYATPSTINNLDSVKNSVPNGTPLSHTYKVTLKGYKDISGKFNIIAGKTTTVHIILEKTGINAGEGAALVIAAVAVAGLIAKKQGE